MALLTVAKIAEMRNADLKAQRVPSKPGCVFLKPPVEVVEVSSDRRYLAYMAGLTGPHGGCIKVEHCSAWIMVSRFQLPS